MNRMARRLGYPVFVLSFFALMVAFLIWQSTLSDWHDFDVFYDAARAALAGGSIYIIVGKYNLPFWYFPWTAWFFIPFAAWSRPVGLLLYQVASVLSVVLVVRYLTRFYDGKFRVLDQLVILALLIPMSVELIVVGQMDYILLGLLVLIIWAAATDRPELAGVIYPFLLAKPHLIIPFTVMLFWRLGRRALLTAGITTLILLAAATILAPNWYLEMFDLIQSTGGRTSGLAFTTFPSLLGGRENWIGTANLPFTILLILAALLVAWRFRDLPTVPLLSLALSLSVLCAPRAYAYDLALHIPALTWLASGKFRSTAWIWVVAGLLPQAVGFSSLAYLDTLFVCVLAVRKALLETSMPAAVVSTG